MFLWVGVCGVESGGGAGLGGFWYLSEDELTLLSSGEQQNTSTPSKTIIIITNYWTDLKKCLYFTGNRVN